MRQASGWNVGAGQSVGNAGGEGAKTVQSVRTSNSVHESGPCRTPVPPTVFLSHSERHLVGYTVQYYDLILGAIIGALAFGGIVGAFTAVRMPIAIVLVGAVAIGLMGHAMFVNGPVDQFDDLTEEVEAGPLDDVPLLE